MWIQHINIIFNFYISFLIWIYNSKICSALLCTKCDVKVSIFKNKLWCDSCDYLFFRNNYGDQIKLSERLISDPGSMCYSCQCSWLNVKDPLVEVDKLNSVAWTCNGHNSH